MGRFTVDLTDRRHAAIPWPAGVEVFPERWSWDAMGGAKDATLRLVGPHTSLVNVLEWCRFGVRIRSDRGIFLWGGYVEDASVDMGSYSLGMRMDRMYNRVSVAHTYLGTDGVETRGTTDWAADNYNTFEYGDRELRFSQSDMDPSDAADLASALMDRYKDPAPYLGEGGGSRNVAQLICKGWWNVLNWKYFEFTIGREGHSEGGSGTQTLGAEHTSSNIVFNGNTDDEVYRIYQMGTAIPFKAGERIIVSGSGAGNNGVKNVTSVVTREWITITATTISFSDDDDMYDSASGFDELSNGDWILITGSASNNGMHHIEKVEDQSDTFAGTDYDHVVCEEEDMNLESAGASVSVHRQGYIAIHEQVNNEGPGVSITITPYNLKIAQQFSLTAWEDDWIASEVQVRIRRVGSPTDNVKVAIHANSGGLPGTELDAVTVSYTTIPANSEWVSFLMPTGVLMTAAGVFWIVVSRTGSTSSSNYYELAVDEDAGYANGVMKVWDGSNWQDRAVAADLYFEVWGHEDNAVQLRRMLGYGGLTSNALFGAVVIPTDSGRISRSYRDGESTVFEEVVKLLEQGNNASARYMVEVGDERFVSVLLKPERNQLALRMLTDGSIMDVNNVPVEPGMNIAGRWLALEDKDLPPSIASGFVVFIESAEYDAGSGKWRPRSENIPDPFDYATLRQG